MRAKHVVPVAALCALFAAGCGDGNSPTQPEVQAITVSHFLPSHNDLRAALQDVVAEQNGGLGFEMWATILDRDGKVVDVVFSGENRGDQWPGSRVISAQKANTANAFSLPRASRCRPRTSSRRCSPAGACSAFRRATRWTRRRVCRPASNYGKANDPMVGRRIGGINVFGGGLALYAPSGTLLGGLGVSGDTSCSDHIIAWKLRFALNLDNVPNGPAAGTDNIIFTDGTLDGFEHPECFDANPDVEGEHVPIANNLPTTHPVGPEE